MKKFVFIAFVIIIVGCDLKESNNSSNISRDSVWVGDISNFHDFSILPISNELSELIDTLNKLRSLEGNNKRTINIKAKIEGHDTLLFIYETQYRQDSLRYFFDYSGRIISIYFENELSFLFLKPKSVCNFEKYPFPHKDSVLMTRDRNLGKVFRIINDSSYIRTYYGYY